MGRLNDEPDMSAEVAARYRARTKESSCFLSASLRWREPSTRQNVAALLLMARHRKNLFRRIILQYYKNGSTTPSPPNFSHRKQEMPANVATSLGKSQSGGAMRRRNAGSTLPKVAVKWRKLPLKRRKFRRKSKVSPFQGSLRRKFRNCLKFSQHPGHCRRMLCTKSVLLF